MSPYIWMPMKSRSGARVSISVANSALKPDRAVAVGWFGSTWWIIFEMSLMASKTFGFLKRRFASLPMIHASSAG